MFRVPRYILLPIFESYRPVSTSNNIRYQKSRPESANSNSRFSSNKINSNFKNGTALFTILLQCLSRTQNLPDRVTSFKKRFSKNFFFELIEKR